MRLVYFGTPDLAVGPLRALVDAGHQVVLVVTQPDRRRGRGKGTSPTPVKAAALEIGLPVTHRTRDVLDVEAELGVLVIFGRLIKPDVLAHLTILNIHPSLLPRWRGCTPVESAILAGDTETGVCVMKLEEGMDTGPVYAQARTNIEANETAQALLARLVVTGTDLLIDQLGNGLATPQPQHGEATYAEKLAAEDQHIDWKKSAEEIHRLVRVGRPWTTFRDKRLILLEAKVDVKVDENGETGEPGALDATLVTTGSGKLQLITVQPEGKGPQNARSWANGARPMPGEQLG